MWREKIRDAAAAALAPCAAFALAACLAPAAIAQAPAPAQTGARGAAAASDSQARAREGRDAQAQQTQAGAEPDLSITARVTARELRFEKVPNPRVEFTGEPRRETVWDAVRENLPEQVQPGVTYRNVGITLRITSVFADIDRIVAEALGEIPISDDAPAAPPTTERPAERVDNPTPSHAVNASAATALSSAPPSPPADARTKRRAGPARKGRGR